MNAAGRILRHFSWALLLLLVPATSVAATPNRDPLPHADAADAPGSPLDMRSVTLGQRGTELILRITTAQEWDTSLLDSADGSLCVSLYYGQLATPRSRICVVPADGEPSLVYTRLDPFGGTAGTSVVNGNVRRTDSRSVQAIFDPSAVNLGQGRYSWQAQSQWACEPRAECTDFAPDNGNVIAQIKPIAEPPCFGAAARNPRYRCRNPTLRLAVFPTPAQAELSPNSRCAEVSFKRPSTCQFGVRPGVAHRSVALIGDSHATHWRGALEVVARIRGWRGYSITRAGCPLSTAPPAIDKGRRESCANWRRDVLKWLRDHPQVRTVFVSQLAGLDVLAPRGRDRGEYEIQGFLGAWRRLPSSVRQIIVLRDTPVTSESSASCVEAAMARRRPAGTACAIARRRALRRDPAAIAARRPGMRRVHVIDLTRFMCSPRLCFPVVGGVLVHKDNTHITNIFSTTLGPFVERGVSALI